MNESTNGTEGEQRLGRARQQMFDALFEVMHPPGAAPAPPEVEQRLARLLRAWLEWESALSDRVTYILNAGAHREREQARRVEALEEWAYGGTITVSSAQPTPPPGHDDPEEGHP